MRMIQYILDSIHWEILPHIFILDFIGLIIVDFFIHSHWDSLTLISIDFIHSKNHIGFHTTIPVDFPTFFLWLEEEHLNDFTLDLSIFFQICFGPSRGWISIQGIPLISKNSIYLRLDYLISFTCPLKGQIVVWIFPLYYYVADYYCIKLNNWISIKLLNKYYIIYILYKKNYSHIFNFIQ